MGRPVRVHRPGTSPPAHTVLGTVLLCGSLACGTNLSPVQDLFHLPLAVEGQPVGEAFIDTGGGYEVLLEEPFGLEIVGEVQVLAFGGVERVRLTESFSYSVGGFHTVARGALVGLSVCQCNGIGYQFFRRTGLVLRLDFPARAAALVLDVPSGGEVVPYDSPPASLPDFRSSFIEVEVASGGRTQRLAALLDTGARVTVLRREYGGTGSIVETNRRRAVLTHDVLGPISVDVALFDTEGLPDLIVGMDVMRRWADEWYFDFSPGGGSITIFRDGPGEGVSRARP